MTSRRSGWTRFPPQAKTIDKGHGRLERRRIWTSQDLNRYVDFPYVRQVFRVERVVCNLDGTKQRCEVAYGITSVPAHVATPAQLLQLNRGHWGIENGVHWVRDVTFDEDRCRVRKGTAAQVMASLRNLVIALLRLAGASNIASELRHLARHIEKALRLIGL